MGDISTISPSTSSSRSSSGTPPASTMSRNSFVVKSRRDTETLIDSSGPSLAEKHAPGVGATLRRVVSSFQALQDPLLDLAGFLHDCLLVEGRHLPVPHRHAAVGDHRLPGSPPDRVAPRGGGGVD